MAAALKRLRSLLRFALVTAAACAPAVSAPPPAAVRVAPPPAPVASAPVEQPPSAQGMTLVALGHRRYIDPGSTPEQRAAVERWYGEGVANVAGTFGPATRTPPGLVVCFSEACQARFSGGTRRSHVFEGPAGLGLYIVGFGPLTRGTILHEMVHVEIIRRMGPRERDLPTWFNEGVSSLIGDNAPCSPRYQPPIDDLRRLASAGSWKNFTDTPGLMEASYCQARSEVAAWAARHGRAALVGVIDAVTAGKRFADVYGDLVIPPTVDARLDASFSFDQDDLTDGVTGRDPGPLASLVGGGWTRGQHGSAIKVEHGAYLRVDGLLDYGLPDKAFTVTLWARPRASSGVLIHAAVPEEGEGGWCASLLGHDAEGHLVAQLLTDGRDPSAFVSVSGPAPAPEKWTHVGVTWSAESGLRLYENGVVVASEVPAAAEAHHRDAPAAPVHLFFGSDDGGRCFTKSIVRGHWAGALDDLHVYNYSLSAAQLQADRRGQPIAQPAP